MRKEPPMATDTGPQELEHHDAIVVGSGFAGLGMAIQLRRHGMHDFVVLERAGTVGGTWRDNHYPGCACDVPTPLYSFSFAPNPDWSHLYARHEELRAYLEACTDRFGVRDHLRFGMDVTGAAWDEDRRRWIVEVAGEPAMTGRVLIGGFGGLSRPAYPAIAGLEDFAGHLFHSAQWEHGVDLRGKRVGVIGTGASAIQLVPRVAKVADRVEVFQRTPAWIIPKLDVAIGARAKALFRRVPATQRALRALIFAITESVGYPITRKPSLLKGLEARARQHLARQVPDPALRAKLTPASRIGCKRILLSNDYYPALTQDHVDLVTAPIERVTATGVVTADGVEHELDALVCGTGFRVEEVYMALDIRGRGGRHLRDVWAGGIEAHRGTSVAGFPNLALLSGPNTGTGSTSQVYMIESQVHYVLEMLRAMRRGAAAQVEVRQDAQDAYNAWLQARMQDTVWLRGGCDSWYLDANGVNRTLYPGLSSAFRRSLRDFRVDEHVLEPARHAPPAAAPAAPPRIPIEEPT
jgi:cation diffusion facilitator CzcD-associated flavoprotein CzcO